MNGKDLRQLSHLLGQFDSTEPSVFTSTLKQRVDGRIAALEVGRLVALKQEERERNWESNLDRLDDCIDMYGFGDEVTPEEIYRTLCDDDAVNKDDCDHYYQVILKAEELGFQDWEPNYE